MWSTSPGDVVMESSAREGFSLLPARHRRSAVAAGQGLTSVSGSHVRSRPERTERRLLERRSTRERHRTRADRQSERRCSPARLAKTRTLPWKGLQQKLVDGRRDRVQVGDARAARGEGAGSDTYCSRPKRRDG